MGTFSRMALAHRPGGRAAAFRPRQDPELMGDMAKGIKSSSAGNVRTNETTGCQDRRASQRREPFRARQREKASES